MVRIREAGIADAAGIARVHVDSWRSTYAGVLPDRVLVGLNYRQRATMWKGILGQHRLRGHTLVAEDTKDGIVGFGSCGRASGGLPDYGGEVFTLYIDDDHQRLGIGRMLLSAMFRRLAREGLPSVVIWALRDNPARFFYESQGGKMVGTRTERVGDASLIAVAYGWPDVRTVLSAGPPPSLS